MFPRILDANTPIVIQGITGKEGSRMAGWMKRSGANIVAGVTPGKGGQSVEGIPVFNSISEAVSAHGAIEASCIVVPPVRVLEAFQSALDAGIRLVHVLTENVPVHDVLEMRRLASGAGVSLLGPASVGYLQFPRFRLGYMGGERPFESCREGDLAVLSTSGGMANEIIASLSRVGVGIRLAVALGGGWILGTSIGEAVRACEQLPEVKRIVVFVEPGQPFVQALASGTFRPEKPLIVLMPGECLDHMPKDRPFGHAGTIVGEQDMSVQETKVAIRRHGTVCVDGVPELVQAVLQYG